MVLRPQTFFFSTSHFALTQIPAALPPRANISFFEFTYSIHKDCAENQMVGNCVRYAVVQNVCCVSEAERVEKWMVDSAEQEWYTGKCGEAETWRLDSDK